MKYKYKNYDKRCKYPYTHDGLNYCWGYATWVDNKTITDKEMNCKGCEFFKDTKSSIHPDEDFDSIVNCND